MSTVHVVRAGALGDVLWTEPVLRQLAARHARVVLHTRFAAVFGGYPLPNVEFRERLSRPACALRALLAKVTPGVHLVDLDMSYERRQKMHLLHAYQEVAGLPRSREYPRVPLPAVLPACVRELPERFVALHLESGPAQNYRRVHGVDWGRVVAALRSHGRDVVQLGIDPPPIDGARHLRTSLGDLAPVLARCEAFVGVDSGPSHVAAALGRPCALFFGAVNPAFRHFPELLRGTILQRPCEFAGCYHEVVGIRGPSCRLVGDAGVPKCSAHTTEAVVEAVLTLLRAPEVPR